MSRPVLSLCHGLFGVPIPRTQEQALGGCLQYASHTEWMVSATDLTWQDYAPKVPSHKFARQGRRK